MESGMNYAPIGRNAKVVEPGEFVFAAAKLKHGHINGMSQGLKDAGATLKWVYDDDPELVRAFIGQFPEAKAARSLHEILEDTEVKLVAGADITSERCALGLQVMDSGKDYFTDKAPLTTFEQLEAARKKHRETGMKYAVYYSERIHSECAVLAGELIKEGAIGRVIQVLGLGPHRVGARDTRPDWFFEREKYGGILCDIGSHQCEQFLYYTGAESASVTMSRRGNFAHSDTPGLDDFGEASLLADNGASGYFRVDWFTPNALQSWGDGRTFILGTDGFIELRKYLNLAATDGADTLLLANHDKETKIDAKGTVGYPFFGQLIQDCINRTETAMTQAHAFLAAELSITAQLGAAVISGI